MNVGIVVRYATSTSAHSEYAKTKYLGLLKDIVPSLFFSGERSAQWDNLGFIIKMKTNTVNILVIIAVIKEYTLNNS